MNEENELMKRKIIDFCLENGILLSSEILENIDSLSSLSGFDINQLSASSQLVLDRSIFRQDEGQQGYATEKKQVSVKITNYPNKNEKPNENSPLLASDEPKAHALANEASLPYTNVDILSSYDEKPKKRDVQDFIDHFLARYKSIEKILRNRQELVNATTITRVLQRKEKESVSIIGMVTDKQLTKNENLSLKLEDPTGEINVVVNKSKPQLYALAKNITFDEVIGVVGVSSNKVIFANNIIWPDAPSRELKKCDEEVYAIFLSDMHVGSKYFMREKFERFLKWINGESGNDEQRHIAANTRYVIIAGDIVDGVGIYPNQENELDIIDIRDQYSECARLLDQIPKRMKLIICPGNHDAMRLSEPQPVFYRDLSGVLLDLENAFFVTNPAIVNLHSSKNFQGMEIMLYHGASFDYYIANIESIRFNGGYDRADLVMKFLIQRRHLAPAHNSTLYIPDPDRDPLVIDRLPDFLVTGHLHKTAVAQYKSTTLICGSCWQDITAYQLKRGHHPEPGRVPIANLKTREMKILRF